MTQHQPHGRLERLLHRLAFATGRAQLGLADLETRWFRRELSLCSPDRAVWIAGLPRAGSTLLHEMLAACPEFATQTYRDVPFVATPLLWHRLARPFWRDPGRHERAHGDGMAIGPDSPAAVEENLWLQHFAARYRSPTQQPWPDEVDAEFAQLLADHRRKVVALRRRTEPRASRYLAKNNQHVLRVPLLLQMAPDARLLVPFRDPVAQCTSLHRQHRHFAAMHRTDAFAARAMRHLGHFDFGANHRAIDFGGWIGNQPTSDPDDPNHWLAYWVAAYDHLSTFGAQVRIRFVDPTRLRAAEDAGPLAEWLGLDSDTELQAAMRRVRPPARQEGARPTFAPALLTRAEALFTELQLLANRGS